VQNLLKTLPLRKFGKFIFNLYYALEKCSQLGVYSILRIGYDASREGSALVAFPVVANLDGEDNYVQTESNAFR